MYEDDDIAKAMLHEERVDNIIALIMEKPGCATGWNEFDVAWISLRRARPTTPPDRCPTTRTLVSKLADKLELILTNNV